MAATMTKNHTMRNAYIPVRQNTQPTTRKKPQVAVKSVGNLEMSAASLRKAFLWTGGLLAVLMLFIGLGLGLIKLYHYCTTSEYFSIENINISGNQLLSEEDILTLSGIQKGENILIINIPDMEYRLLQNPWIEQVFIQRKLPNQFFINIHERIAKFLVLKQGSIYYLDDHGKLIAPVSKHNFQSLPMLNIGSGGEDALESLSYFMDKISYMQLPFDISQISWLKLSAAKGFELYWENKQLSLSIGIEDWNENLQRLAMVIADTETRKEIANIREIRAADGQVWLQKI